MTFEKSIEKSHEELIAQRNEIVGKFWEETKDPTTLEEVNVLMMESIERHEQFIQEYRGTHKMPSRGRIITPSILAEEEIQKQLAFKQFAIRRQLGEQV